MLIGERCCVNTFADSLHYFSIGHSWCYPNTICQPWIPCCLIRSNYTSRTDDITTAAATTTATGFTLFFLFIIFSVLAILRSSKQLISCFHFSITPVFSRRLVFRQVKMRGFIVFLFLK